MQGIHGFSPLKYYIRSSVTDFRKNLSQISLWIGEEQCDDKSTFSTQKHFDVTTDPQGCFPQSLDKPGTKPQLIPQFHKTVIPLLIHRKQALPSLTFNRHVLKQCCKTFFGTLATEESLNYTLNYRGRLPWHSAKIVGESGLNSPVARQKPVYFRSNLNTAYR